MNGNRNTHSLPTQEACSPQLVPPATKARPSVVGVSVTCLVVTAMGMSQAHAYIDPGSGSLMLQAFGAMLFGCLYYFRRSIAYLARRLKGRGKGDTDQQ